MSYMIKNIGITGQNGFVGFHLFQTINLLKEEFSLVEFKRDYFEQANLLDEFVGQCDVIVHLAALNRHNDPEEIYRTNTQLVQKLIDSVNRVNKKIHILISSSSQEERDNLYGKSKKEGREKLANWSSQTGNPFTGLIIPNVFGPFGHPYYNSVVATFCHQVARNEIPRIEVDSKINLIYVGELVQVIIQSIREELNSHTHAVSYTCQAVVSEILNLLNHYKEVYQENGEIPAINSTFELNLFNTFRCYMDIEEYFPRLFKLHEDNRGAFVEIIRLGIGGQVSFSTTVPGITRGNHFHTRKIERFAVIKGKAKIELRKIGTDKVIEFFLDGKNPAYVDMPIWYTHNITNIGDEILYTNFWINEPYNSADADTWMENVKQYK